MQMIVKGSGQNTLCIAFTIYHQLVTSICFLRQSNSDKHKLRYGLFTEKSIPYFRSTVRLYHAYIQTRADPDLVEGEGQKIGEGGTLEAVVFSTSKLFYFFNIFDVIIYANIFYFDL